MTSISLPGYNATIGNLVINGTLSVSGRMFIHYATSNAQTLAPGATTVQFPNVITATNVTGLTVSGTNNTTFTNTSGVQKTWSISFNGFAYNTDSVNTSARFNSAIFLNGTGSGLASSAFVPYNASASGGGAYVGGVLTLQPNDYITITFTTSIMTTNTVFNSGTLIIAEI